MPKATIATKTRPTEAKPGQAEAEKDGIPNWVENTPLEHSYGLIMFESSEVGIQEIDLTRDEYIALKTHLAELRGYGSPRVA